MKLKKTLQLWAVTGLLCLTAFPLYGQVTIGCDLPPVKGAILDLKQQDEPNGLANSVLGMGLPRVNLTSLTDITADIAGVTAANKDAHIGLTVYNLTQCDGKFARGVYTWSGTEWEQLTRNPILTGGNPALAFTPGLPGNPAFIEIPSGQDLRTAWTSAYAPSVDWSNAGSVTGAWSNTVGGGLVFTANALTPTDLTASGATWTTSPISNISVWPDAMTTSDLASNPFLTRESGLTVTGIAGVPCPGTNQSQVITLNQTNYAIVPGTVASPVSQVILRTTSQQALNILSNVKWQAAEVSPQGGSVALSDILGSYTMAKTGSERHDGSSNTNTFNYTSTNPVTQGKKYETAQVTFSDVDGRAKPVTVTVMQCLGTPDMSSVNTNADNAATSAATAPSEWSGKVVRHAAKPNPAYNAATDPAYMANIYEEFYSAEFGTAGRWMTTNLAARSYDTNILSSTAELTTSPDASNSTDPRWCYTSPGGDGTDATAYSNNPHIGLLYNWAAATAKKSSSSDEGNSNHAAVQGICPNGWHLPSDYEWNELEKVIYEYPELYSSYADNSAFPNSGNWDDSWNSSTGSRPSSATDAHGKAMKEFCGLNGQIPNGLSNNLASGGFSALLAGVASVTGLVNYGYAGNFWNSSSYNNLQSWSRVLNSSAPAMIRIINFRSGLFSVRCKKDEPLPPPAPLSSDVSLCTAGSVTLTATAGANVVVDWYDAATGGNRVQDGEAASTNDYNATVAASTSYYAEARDLNTGLTSTTRTEVVVAVETDLLAIKVSATPAETSAPGEQWNGKVVRHAAKYKNDDPLQGTIYEEFASAVFGTAGRWMTTNLAAWAYDTNVIGGVTLPSSPDASNSDADPRWCYPGNNSSEIPDYGNTDPMAYNNNPFIGLLYNWPAATAKKSEASDEANQDHAPVQGICPNGWHLPSDYEWNELEKVIYERPELYSGYADNSAFPNSGNWNASWNTATSTRPTSGSDAHGKAMKAVCELNNKTPDGRSYPRYRGGFSIRLAGAATEGATTTYGTVGYFWTSSAGNVAAYAWERRFLQATSRVARWSAGRRLQYSVRCKKD